MSTALVLYVDDRLAQVRTWAKLHPTERRRRCLAALRTAAEVMGAGDFTAEFAE